MRSTWVYFFCDRIRVLIMSFIFSLIEFEELNIKTLFLGTWLKHTWFFLA
jgi:hypothetical protein